MNARTVRLKKEARALFWPWCAVMIAGALRLVPHASNLLGGIPFGNLLNPAGFFFGIPLLATLSFGNEFQCRTLSLLLSQPAGRMEIWREKLMVTAAAVVSAAVVFAYGWRSVLNQEQLVVAGLYVMAMTASATFWTLSARSTIGGLALACLPIGGFELAGFTVNILLPGFFERLLDGDLPPRETMTVLSAVSIVAFGYAGLMLWLGARKLARFQVTGGMAGDDLVMAGPNLVPEALAGWLRYRPTEPFLNLIRKELRLLRTLWPIALLVVLYMTCLTVLRLLPDAAHWNVARRKFDTVRLFVLSPLMAIPVMAILAGCLSLGEERTSGTHSWHMTLPVPARRQWLIKLLVAVFTGFVCAVLLPVLVLLAGGNLSFGGPVWFVDPRAAVEWLITVPLLSLVAFWCACAVNGTVRAAIWLFPVTYLIYLAAACGGLIGQELAKITGTLRDFVVSWFQLTPPPQAYINTQFTGLTFLWLLVPVLLLAVIQSYRLFRTQPQGSIPWMIRCLLPLALAAFLCGFSVSAGWAATRWEPFYETVEGIEKLHAGGATAQLTVEDLGKGYPLSQLTRRWLRDSSISVVPDQAHSGYFATIHLASGLDCKMAVGHYGGRSFGREKPYCAQKGP